MNLLMVRHGEIFSNIQKIYAGRNPEGLTARGIEQAEEAARKLRSLNIHSIYSSPIRRAVQTAEIINSKIQKNILIDSAFRELELGPWEGLSEAAIAEAYPDEWDVWNKKPAELKLAGRETLQQLLDRVLIGIRGIQKNIGDGNVVIVTHVAIIRVLLLWQEGKSLNLYKSIQVPNAEIFDIKA